MCDLDRMQLNRHWCGLTAVFARELTREAVFRAIQERRCYATTGARILADFEVDGVPMGGEGVAGGPATVRARVAGTAPLKSLTIVRNNVDVHQVEGMGLDQELVWTDYETRAGSYYYLRVIQEDGHLAWASPVWLD